MKALVLAAGRGSRTADVSASKPLLRLMGLPLIERTIATAIRAGVDEVVVVIGHQADRVEPLLIELARRRRVAIRIVRADGWAAGNGASLLAARAYLEEPFILMMGDHVVSETILERLIARGLAGDACVLAVDRGRSPWVDPSDVTRVYTEGDRIVAIGKGLPDSETYDTGVFLCSPELFDAAERALRRGDGSVSGAVRELAGRGAAAVLDVSGEFWIDVDTARDARRARRLLAAELGKSRDGWVSRVLNRPVSKRALTPLLMRLYSNVTPNQVSVLSFLVAALAAAGFTLGQPVVGALAVHLASVLDGSDGEIARLKRLESPFGRFLDSVLDRYADSLILLGLLFFTWTASANLDLFGPALGKIVLVVGMLAISGNWLVSYTTVRAAADLGHRYEERWIAGGRGRDLRLLIVTISGLAAAFHPAAALFGLGAIAALTNAIVLRRLAASYAVTRGADRLASVEAVIYDLDGTLLDSMPTLTAIATALITEQYGIDVEVARRRYLETAGTDFATQLEELFPSHLANGEVGAEFERRKEHALRDVRPFAEAMPTLRRFQSEGVRQFVCSSTCDHLVVAALQRTGLLACLDGWTGYDAGFDKGLQIRSLVAEHGLDSARTLFLGDSPRDSDYARRGGVTFRGIARSHDAKPFLRMGAEASTDLRSIVRAWRRARRAVDAARSTAQPQAARPEITIEATMAATAPPGARAHTAHGYGAPPANGSASTRPASPPRSPSPQPRSAHGSVATPKRRSPEPGKVPAVWAEAIETAPSDEREHDEPAALQGDHASEVCEA